MRAADSCIMNDYEKTGARSRFASASNFTAARIDILF